MTTCNLRLERDDGGLRCSRILVMQQSLMVLAANQAASLRAGQ